MTKPSIVDWHRLFGITVELDFLDYVSLQIEREKDLSFKEQLLDLLILYTDNMETVTSFLDNPPKPLPDGLENLSQHNLVTYKSLREPLNEWTLQELIGHYVNHRKNTAIKGPEDTYSKLLPEDHFHLYAVCTRFPKSLMTKHEAKNIKQGVYEIVFGGLPIRIIVLSQVPKARHNAIWNIFSNVIENIEYGASQYRSKLEDMSSVLDRLFEFYNLEGTHMAYTFEQFEKEHFLDRTPRMLQDEEIQPSFMDKIFTTLGLDKFISKLLDGELRQISLRKIYAKLSTDERLEGLSPDERIEGLSSDQRLKGLSFDQRLKGLSPDEIKVYLQQIESKNQSESENE